MIILNVFFSFGCRSGDSTDGVDQLVATDTDARSSAPRAYDPAGRG